MVDPNFRLRHNGPEAHETMTALDPQVEHAMLNSMVYAPPVPTEGAPMPATQGVASSPTPPMGATPAPLPPPGGAASPRPAGAPSPQLNQASFENMFGPKPQPPPPKESVAEKVNRAKHATSPLKGRKALAGSGVPKTRGFRMPHADTMAAQARRAMMAQPPPSRTDLGFVGPEVEAAAAQARQAAGITPEMWGQRPDLLAPVPDPTDLALQQIEGIQPGQTMHFDQHGRRYDPNATSVSAARPSWRAENPWYDPNFDYLPFLGMYGVTRDLMEKVEADQPAAVEKFVMAASLAGLPSLARGLMPGKTGALLKAAGAMPSASPAPYGSKYADALARHGKDFLQDESGALRGTPPTSMVPRPAGAQMVQPVTAPPAPPGPSRVLWAVDKNADAAKGFTGRRLNDPDYELVDVDIERLMKATEKWQRIPLKKGAKSKNIIGDRIAQAKAFWDSGKKMNPSVVGLNDAGGVVFEDGRHRLAAAHQRGQRTAPVLVSKEQAARLRELYGPKPPASLGTTLKDVGYRTDNPGGSWLERERKYAEEATSAKSHGRGPLTATLGLRGGGAEIRVDKLSGLPGAMGEEVFRTSSEKITRLRKRVEEDGWEPDAVMVYVDYDGKAYIGEGNHRVALAVERGEEYIPVDIRYFAGGEQMDGPLNPQALEAAGVLRVPGAQMPAQASMVPGGSPMMTRPLASFASEETPLLRPLQREPDAYQKVEEGRKILDAINPPPEGEGILSRAERSFINSKLNAGTKGNKRAKEIAIETKGNFADDAWMPIEVNKVKRNAKGEVSGVEFKGIKYGFDEPPKGVTPEQHQKNLTGTMVRDVENLIQMAAAGDEMAIKILKEANWYRSMRSRLRREFGGLADVFADVIGATSAQTGVTQNWDNAIEVLRRFSRGEFDAEIAAFAKRMDEGLDVSSKKLSPMHKSGEFPLITKASGALFNSNSPAATRALLGLFRDIKKGGSPKTPNFTANLLGLVGKATIDVWAARYLRQAAGKRRIPPPAEIAVTGEHQAGSMLTAPIVDKEFGFGQKVFADAADEINKRGNLALYDPSLGKLGDDDLQAVVWFLEKDRWTKGGWTSKAGEGGSLDIEASFAGAPEQGLIDTLRKSINKKFKVPKRRKKESEVGHAKRVAEARRARTIADDEARAELKGLRQPVRRLGIGLSAERPGVTPSNRTQAEMSGALSDTLKDDASVIGYKFNTSRGSFMGETEIALDGELVVRGDFDPGPLTNKTVEIAKAKNQDAAFVYEVVDATHPNARPGIEIYFTGRVDRSVVDKLTEALRKRDVDGFTFVADMRQGDMPRFKVGTRQPGDAGTTGLRFQYVPEWADGDDAFSPETMERLADHYRGVLDDIRKASSDISSAEVVHYDTKVIGRDGYDDFLAGR